MTWSVALIQGEKKIEGDDLKRADIRCLTKASLVGRARQIGKLELRAESERLAVELETQIGAMDNILGLHGEMVWLKEDETMFRWKSAVTLDSGKPQIVHSYQQDGKWCALVVEARTLWVSDWLLGE